MLYIPGKSFFRKLSDLIQFQLHTENLHVIVTEKSYFIVNIDNVNSTVVFKLNIYSEHETIYLRPRYIRRIAFLGTEN